MDTTPLDEYQAALHRLSEVAARGRQTPATATLQAAVTEASDWVDQCRSAIQAG